MPLNIIADPLFQHSLPEYLYPLGTPLWGLRSSHWHIRGRVTDWPEPVSDDVRRLVGRAVALSPGWGGIYQWIGFAGERHGLGFAIRADGGAPVSLRIDVTYLDPGTNTCRRVEHLKSRADIMWFASDNPFAPFGVVDVAIERAPDAYIGSICVTNTASASEGGAVVYVGWFDLQVEAADRRDYGCPRCLGKRAWIAAMTPRSLEIDSDLSRPDYGRLIWEPPAPADTVFAQHTEADWLQSIDHEVDSLSHRVERLEKLLAKRRVVEPA